MVGNQWEVGNLLALQILIRHWREHGVLIVLVIIVNVFCENGYMMLFLVENVNLEFEQPQYEVTEDIGSENFALRVCLRASDLQFPRNISLYTSDVTTQGKSRQL